MDFKGERPTGVVTLLWIYLMSGLILLLIGIIALSEDTSGISNADLTFIRFFMIIGSVLSLIVFLMLRKGMPSAWYAAVAVALIKLAYCVLLAASEPGHAGVLVVALIEIAIVGVLMTESVRTYLIE